MNTSNLDQDETWVFGYGSLIWKVDFPVVKGVPCSVVGYQRRLWQGSTDHRGVPGAPGRVVTLLSHDEFERFGLETEGAGSDACVEGIVYQIDPQARDSVLDHLDYREKCGYVRESVSVHLAAPLDDGRTSLHNVLVYRATPENPDFLGPPPGGLLAIAQQVLSSSGPSGTNLHYVSNLNEALLQHSMVDAHISQIMQEINTIQQPTPI